MINFQVFFKNHFDTKEVSDDNLRKYSDIHLQRLNANNPGGIYTTLITDTGAKYTAYFGDIGDEAVKTAVKEGATTELYAIISDFKNTVSQKEGTIRGLYGVNSGTYQQFFPQGVTAYRDADLTNIHTFTQLIRDASTAHVADLGAPFVAIFTNFHTNILAKRQAQLLLMGEVEGARDSTELSRNDIETQLMTNVLTIAVNNIGNFSAIDTYFDQSFLQRGGPSSETFDGIVIPAQIANILERTFLQDDEITIENTGTVDLTFGLVKLIGDAPTTLVVLAGTITTVTADQLGDVTQNTFLNVTNNAVSDGSYSVTI